MRAKVTAALIGTNLAALLFTAWIVGAALSEPVFPQGNPDPSDTTPSPSIVASVSNDALLNNPLFTPSRQPQSAPEQEPMPPPPPPAPPRLVGIVKERAKARRALLETATGEVRRVLHTGQVFEGWIVTEIHRNAVTLTRRATSGSPDPGTELSLHLYPDG